MLENDFSPIFYIGTISVSNHDKKKMKIFGLPDRLTTERTE